MVSCKAVIGLLTLAVMGTEAHANVVGSELQNFNAAPSVSDYATVGSARTLGAGSFSLGLFANTAINSLPYFREGEEKLSDRKKRINDSVSIMDVQIAYGLLDNWDLSISAPSVIQQSVRERVKAHGEFNRLGNMELRLGSKVQLMNTESFQLALQGTANYNRVDGNPYTGEVRWPGASLELVTTTQIGIIDWSVNVGHRWRNSKANPALRATLPIDPAGNQWLASTGVALDLPATDMDIIGEIYGAYAERNISDLSTRKNAIAETVVGIRKPLPNDFQFHAGLGTELNHSVSSADYRAYIGIRWMVDAKRKPADTVTVVPRSEVKLASVGVLDRPADVVLELEDIYFKFDSTEFRDPKAQALIRQLGEALQAKPVERVIIEGYACALGTDEYNFDLSDHRASAIERMLIQQFSVAPEKLVTVGWGEHRAKFDNSREQTRMNNRRVTFRIFYKSEIAAGSQNVAH